MEFDFFFFFIKKKKKHDEVEWTGVIRKKSCTPKVISKLGSIILTPDLAQVSFAPLKLLYKQARVTLVVQFQYSVIACSPQKFAQTLLRTIFNFHSQTVFLAEEGWKEVMSKVLGERL